MAGDRRAQASTDEGAALQAMLENDVPHVLVPWTPDDGPWIKGIHISKWTTREQKSIESKRLKTNQEIAAEYTSVPTEYVMRAIARQKETKMKLTFDEIVRDVSECVGEDYMWRKVKEIPLNDLMSKLFTKEEVLNFALLEQKDLISLDSQ
jgi:hypothetical protein